MNKLRPLKKNNRIVISLGDPAGIGTEITLKALSSKDLDKNINPLLVGCKNNIYDTYLNLLKNGFKHIPNPEHIDIFNVPLEKKIIPGIVNKYSGEASFKCLSKATKIVLEENARALVTAPISKIAWHKAGHTFAGQTELLGKLTNKVLKRHSFFGEMAVKSIDVFLPVR